MSSAQVKNAQFVQSYMQQDVDYYNFLTQSDFDVSDNFREMVFRDIVPSITHRVNPVTALHFDVQACKAANCHLCVRLPWRYVFGRIDGLGLMIWLLTQQLYGNDGALLTNGRSNIFYVRVSEHVVLLLSIAFDVKESRWCLDAMVQDAFAQWYYDDRVFTPDDGIARVPAGKCMCDKDVRAKTAFISPGDSNRLLI